ncbi:MAG: CHAP domain-containing protein [Spirochaetales bacterium]
MKLRARHWHRLLLILVSSFVLWACALTPVWETQNGYYGSTAARGAQNGTGTPTAEKTAHRPSEAGELSSVQRDIIAAANELLSKQNFLVNGYRYSYDCTGTVLAIYAMAGIHLVDLFPRYSGNGVARLYAIGSEYDLLYHSTIPQPGDLIFWDNTYDKNGDKLWNDELTHVGLVIAVEPNGIVEYVHHDYSKGVVTAKMSLIDPQTHTDATGVLVNSPMRMRSHRHLNPDEWLASHLYRHLGALHQIHL